MNDLLESILASGTVRRADGTSVPLLSNTSRGQCEFIQNIIRRIDASRCLEVGMAYGVSALAAAEVCASLTTIDPYEATLSENIGVLNLERAGYSVRHRHFEEFSQYALPRLASAGEKFDFAYIDTTKVFDSVLVDAFYVTLLLNVGGGCCLRRLRLARR